MKFWSRTKSLVADENLVTDKILVADESLVADKVLVDFILCRDESNQMIDRDES